MRPVIKETTNAGYKNNVLDKYVNQVANIKLAETNKNMMDNYTELKNKVGGKKTPGSATTPKSAIKKSSNNISSKTKRLLQGYKKEIQADNFDELTQLERTDKLDKFLKKISELKPKEEAEGYTVLSEALQEKISHYDDLLSTSETQIKAIYPNSRKFLIQQLGSYCSYCGMLVRASLAVEHQLPKSQFPEKGVDWDNFLLACTNCNSLKGNRPKKDPPKTQVQILADYAWPNVKTDDTANKFTCQVFHSPDGSVRSDAETYTFEDDDGKEHTVRSKTILIDSFTEVDLDQFINEIKKYLGSDKFTLVAAEGFVHIFLKPPKGPSYNWTTDDEKDIQYRRIGIGIVQNSMTEKFEKTIGLANLNKFTVDVDITDRRVPCRTTVFFRVLFILNDLELLKKSGLTTSDLNMLGSYLLEQIKDLISVTGYWEIWYWLLNKFEAAVRTEIKKYLTDITIFPNTELTYL